MPPKISKQAIVDSGLEPVARVIYDSTANVYRRQPSDDLLLLCSSGLKWRGLWKPIDCEVAPSIQVGTSTVRRKHSSTRLSLYAKRRWAEPNSMQCIPTLEFLHRLDSRILTSTYRVYVLRCCLHIVPKNDWTTHLDYATKDLAEQDLDAVPLRVEEGG